MYSNWVVFQTEDLANGIEYTSKPRSLIVLIRWGTYYYSCVNVTFIPSPLQTPAPVSVPVSP